MPRSGDAQLRRVSPHRYAGGHERNARVTAAEAQVARPARRRVLIGGGVLLLGGAATLWLSRVPIATGFIDRELAAQGVPARYRITDLGFGRQRLTDVVIGDPAHPDLVADWIETETDLRWSGPYLRGVRAGRVRLRGRLAEGRVALGAIDRLIGQGGATKGGPVLPALYLDVSDLRMRLETPSGPVGLKLAGSGKLDDGFRGSLAAVVPTVAAGGCTMRDLRAVLSVSTLGGSPTVAGPASATRAACGERRLDSVATALRVTLNERLDHWDGSASDMAAQVVAGPGIGARVVGGSVGFAGDARRTQGKVDLALVGLTVPGAAARSGLVSGRYALGSGGTDVALTAKASDAAVDPGVVRGIIARAATADGTPAAPLVRKAADAAARAARRFDLAADIAGDGAAWTIGRVAAAAVSGARLSIDGDPALRAGPVALGGTVRMQGGDLPQLVAHLSQRRDGAVAGRLVAAPYVAQGARLALSPVDLVVGGGATRVTTRAELSGPMTGGRVDGLTMPVDLMVSRRGVMLNHGCALLSFQRLVTSGLTLDPARLTLCPVGAALVSVVDGAVGGGVRIAAPRLSGRLGQAPLSLAATMVEAGIASRRFTAAGVAVRLGAADRVTRLDIAALDGRMAGRGLGGTLSGGGGQIANVPLVMSAATGDWRFANGRLDLAGALRVADAADSARFRPLDARDVGLALADGTITARGVLAEPTTGTKVADVTISHRLNDGSGSATLDVPRLAFAKGFQPDLLTPLTFGVIADVEGDVSGQGRIAWDANGVTSTGTFRTPDMALAAAFGPVEGLAGEIHFTDLLAMQSAPGQVATIRSLNPGVPVTDGRVVYQTLPGARVQVEGGRWPFSGGELRLDPTTLDFSSARERRLTFRLDGVNAGQFLQQFDFQNLNATGTFDGTLPMIFDDSGGRIEGGTLTAREGGGSIAYVGELTEKDLGFWGNFAFQALRSLTYRHLDLTLNGPLAGEMVTAVRFAGVRQGQGAKSNFLIRRLTRLPIVFNITIRAPFRGLMDSAASFYDPKRLVQRNLQQLLEEQNRRGNATSPAAPTVQPPASEKVP